MTKETVSKFIKLLMAFAIFWMVIGDLITYHQQVIFGVNYFDTHNPFTKPKSKDDGKTLNFKQHKSLEKYNSGFCPIQFGILQEEAQNCFLVSLRLSKLYRDSQLNTLLLNLSCALRAPPLLLFYKFSPIFFINSMMLAKDCLLRN